MKSTFDLSSICAFYNRHYREKPIDLRCECATQKKYSRYKKGPHQRRALQITTYTALCRPANWF